VHVTTSGMAWTVTNGSWLGALPADKVTVTWRSMVL
jgi:hypothetical protein